MNEYRVITKHYVYQSAIVKADTQEEAERIALESDALDWDWVDYGDWSIEQTEALEL